MGALQSQQRAHVNMRTKRLRRLGFGSAMIGSGIFSNAMPPLLTEQRATFDKV
jgi:hypothetical protein